MAGTHELTNNHILNTSKNVVKLLINFGYLRSNLNGKNAIFLNFDTAPRTHGWGEGQTGDTVNSPRTILRIPVKILWGWFLILGPYEAI